MTDIEIRQSGALAAADQTPGIDLRVWAEQARSAAIYAEAVCRTQMVPAAYKGKPEEATAAILAGAELGFSPMASLRAFDNIQGVPAPKAMTLRAVVQAAGHEVVIESSTAEQAVVSARRKGTDTWQTSVWDIARAKLMPQYDKNPNYKYNPAAMLVARATAEACRWIAADAIMGMPYAAEEIEDQPALAPSPIGRRLTVADLDEYPPGFDASPPTDEDRRGVVHEIEQPKPRTEQQRKRMFALWGELGYGDDANRANRLDLTSKFVGRKVESSNDLTADETAVVIARLEARKAEVDAKGGEG